MQSWERGQALVSPARPKMLKGMLYTLCRPKDARCLLTTHTKCWPWGWWSNGDGHKEHVKRESGTRTPPLPKSRLTGALLTGTPLFSVVPRHCFLNTGQVRSAHGSQ